MTIAPNQSFTTTLKVKVEAPANAPTGGLQSTAFTDFTTAEGQTIGQAAASVALAPPGQNGAPGEAAPPEPACATLPIKPDPIAPPPLPAQLSLQKIATVTQCSDAGGGCGFKTAITNSGPGEFNGPIVFEDIVTDENGGLFGTTNIDGGGQNLQQAGVVANVSCRKAGTSFRCDTVIDAKIPAGKTIELPISFKLGAGTAAKQIKSCVNLQGGTPFCASIPLVAGPLLRAEKIGGGNTCVPRCAFAISLTNVGNADAVGPFRLTENVSSLGPGVTIKVLNGDFVCFATSNGGLGCLSTNKGTNILKPGARIDGQIALENVPLAPSYTNCLDYDPKLQIKPSPFDSEFGGRCVTITDTAPKQPNLTIKKIAPNAGSDGIGKCALDSACGFKVVVKSTGSAPWVGAITVNDKLQGGVAEILRGRCVEQPARGVGLRVGPQCLVQGVHLDPDDHAAWHRDDAALRGYARQNLEEERHAHQLRRVRFHRTGSGLRRDR